MRKSSATFAGRDANGIYFCLHAIEDREYFCIQKHVHVYNCSGLFKMISGSLMSRKIRYDDNNKHLSPWNIKTIRPFLIGSGYAGSKESKNHNKSDVFGFLLPVSLDNIPVTFARQTSGIYFFFFKRCPPSAPPPLNDDETPTASKPYCY